MRDVAVVNWQERALTDAEFLKLTDIPPAIEWFADTAGFHAVISNAADMLSTGFCNEGGGQHFFRKKRDSAENCKAANADSHDFPRVLWLFLRSSSVSGEAPALSENDHVFPVLGNLLPHACGNPPQAERSRIVVPRGELPSAFALSQSVAIPKRPDIRQATLLKRERLLKPLRPKVVHPHLDDHRHVHRGRASAVGSRTRQRAVGHIPVGCGWLPAFLPDSELGLARRDQPVPTAQGVGRGHIQTEQA
jgi:hypothetical protein